MLLIMLNSQGGSMSSNKALRILALLMVAVMLSSLVYAGNGKAGSKSGNGNNKDKSESQNQGNSEQGVCEITILPIDNENKVNKDSGDKDEKDKSNEDKSNDDKGKGIQPEDDSNQEIEPVNDGGNSGQGSDNQEGKGKTEPGNAIMPLLPPPAASNPHKDKENKVIIIPIRDEPEPAPCPISNPGPSEETRSPIGSGNSILPIMPPGNSIQPVSPPVEEQQSGGVTPVHDQSSARIAKEKDSDNGIILPPPSKIEMKKIKEVLKLTNDERISDETVQKLIRRQTEDSVSFQEITNTTNELLEDSTEKQIFVDEVINMNKQFVNKFAEAVKEQRPKIKQQVKDYIKTLKEQKTAKVELKTEQIQCLFSGKVNIDSLMEQLWNS